MTQEDQEWIIDDAQKPAGFQPAAEPEEERENKLKAFDFCFALFCFCGIAVGALWFYFFLSGDNSRRAYFFTSQVLLEKTQLRARTFAAALDLERFLLALVTPPEEPPKPEPVKPPAPPSLFAPPSLLLPENGFTLDSSYYNENDYPVFSWDAVTGASSYVWTLVKDDGFTLTALKNETSHALEDLPFLPNGNYTWRVEAVREKNGVITRHGRAAEGSFTVNIAVPDKPLAHEPYIY